jgi:hypothetical protein
MHIHNRSTLSMASPVALAASSAEWAPRWLRTAATVAATTVVVLLASCLAVMMGLS